MKYKTKQKDLILEILKKKKKEFTIKDIYESVKDTAGLTTVYRLVDSLVKEGLIHKSIRDDNTTYYSYLEYCDKENHFYLKCDKCGIMKHVDCGCIDDLSSHIKRKHDFKICKESIIINGLCNKCSKGSVRNAR